MNVRKIARAVNVINKALDDGDLFLASAKGAKSLGYCRQYLWRLLKSGEKVGFKIGDRWFVVSE